MFNKEEIRLASAITICSTILLASCIYIYIFTPQKTAFFQLSLTSPDGAILPPELNVTSGQSNALSIAVQNSMGNIQLCKLNIEFLILNFSGNSLDSIALNNHTFSLNNTDTWTQTFTYQFNNSFKNNQLTAEIVFDNSPIEISANQYNQSLLFQFRFDLWSYDNSVNNYVFTNTWVSSPFIHAMT
jgi:hypothetical protein